MMNKTRILLTVVAAMLAAVLGWRLLPGGGSPTALVAAALHSETASERQQAAVRLIAWPGANKHLEKVLAESQDPVVRAIMVQGLADKGDVTRVDSLFDLLDDPSVSVRASAIGALDRLMRCTTHIPPEGARPVRQKMIERTRERWETLKQYGLLAELARASSLAYYYDQHTGQIFAAPSHLPSAFELPSGPYDGMPAAVRVAVFTAGESRDPAQRVAGWLQTDDYLLEQHGLALPERPAESESTLIKLPGDKAWVYATSPAGKQVVQNALTETTKTLGKKGWRCPRPGS